MLHNVVAHLATPAPEACAQFLVSKFADVDAAVGLTELTVPSPDGYGEDAVLALTVTLDASSPACAALVVEQRLISQLQAPLEITAMATTEFDRRLDD